MRKTKLAAAISLALAGSAGVLNTAQAVNVNPNGVGEVLLFPYYTVRDGNDTLMSIVNTTGVVKAVKVRFLEGKNSKEVLDFNLYLSPYDIWTGSLTKSANGVLLKTDDSSCTVPTIPNNGVEFRNTEYAVTQPDGEDATLDRTREGYVEIIEMGVVTDATLAVAATHVDGTPKDCGVLRDAWAGGAWSGNPNAGIAFNPGGLFGDAVLINVMKGTDYSFKAVALEHFFDIATHTAPGSTLPSLASAIPQSDVFTGADASTGMPGVLSSTWFSQGGGVDAVSAALMHDAVMNQYVSAAGLSAGTDWVVTFPTKRFYVPVHDTSNGGSPVAATPPFTQSFWTGGAPEEVGLAVWNREEGGQTGGIDFSPQPHNTNALSWEVNVITFNDSSVLGSKLELNVDTSSIGENGWMRLTFPKGTTGSSIVNNPAAHTLTDDGGNTYLGLPVIGFAAEQYVNGDVDGLRANYGGLFEHKYTHGFSGVAP